MPVCNDPSNSHELVEGAKYEVYPKEEDGNELIFAGWFVTKQQQGEEFEQSVIAIFRTDRPQQPNEAMADADLYEIVPIWGDGGEREGARYRYCRVDELAEGMANMQIEDGGRRKRRGKKTRKPKRRARKTKRTSK